MVTTSLKSDAITSDGLPSELLFDLGALSLPV